MRSREFGLCRAPSTRAYALALDGRGEEFGGKAGVRSFGYAQDFGSGLERQLIASTSLGMTGVKSVRQAGVPTLGMTGIRSIGYGAPNQS